MRFYHVWFLVSVDKEFPFVRNGLCVFLRRTGCAFGSVWIDLSSLARLLLGAVFFFFFSSSGVKMDSDGLLVDDLALCVLVLFLSSSVFRFKQPKETFPTAQSWSVTVADRHWKDRSE